MLGAVSPSAVQAQELVHRFINPSFGGNPFYSDHLLGVATAQRPERASAARQQLSDAERFAQQIQSRILSALSSSIVEAITGAAPGTSGEFRVGDQTIFFERTLTEIRLIITDTNTGEVTEIVVPILDLSGGGGGAPNPTGGGSSIAGGPGLGSGLGAGLATPTPPAAGSGSILSPPPLEPTGITGGRLQF